MRFKGIYIIIIFFLFSPSILKSQTDSLTVKKEYKNIFYGTLGYGLLYFSGNLNYERTMFTPENRFINKINFRLSYGGYATWGADGSTYMSTLNFITGKNKHHLEIDGGFVVFFDKSGYDIGLSNSNYPYQGYEPEPTKADYTDLYPAVSLAYRFQKPSGRFVLRTGIGWPDALFISIGFAF